MSPYDTTQARPQQGAAIYDLAQKHLNPRGNGRADVVYELAHPTLTPTYELASPGPGGKQTHGNHGPRMYELAEPVEMMSYSRKPVYELASPGESASRF